MQLSELVSAVEDVIKDSAYTTTIIGAMINEAVLKIATGDKRPGREDLTPPMPDLYAMDTVDTALSTGYLSLPSDFNRDLIMVVNSDSELIPIESSFRKFMKKYTDELGGEIFRCVVYGKKLHYRDIPAASVALTVHYYSTPPILTADTDEPDSIPVHLHRKLIVGYVCREIFNKIEDGIEGQKINTTYYDAEYQTGLNELTLAIGEDGDPDYYDDQTEYCE